MSILEEKKKFKKFRENQGFNQKSFAEKLNIATGSIGMIESEKSEDRVVTANIKIKIKQVFGIDFDTDIDTEGNIIKKSNFSSQNVIAIPFYSAKASAGSGETLPDYPEEKVIYFDRRFLQNIIGVNPEHAAIIQAKGDSMDGGNKPIKDGDLLIIDDSVKEIINDRIFVIQLNTDLLVKRVIKEWDGTVRLISNNPKYEDRILKENETAEIKGEVVWNSSKENV